MKQRNLFTNLLSLLNVKYTNYSVREFNEYPHKYDLYGLHSLLSEYNIETQAYLIQDKINNLPTPFVAHIWADFVIVKQINPEKVVCLTDDKRRIINTSDFCDIWSFAFLFVIKNQITQEPNYYEHKRQEVFDPFRNI